jgi:O-methyltransferase domain
VEGYRTLLAAILQKNPTLRGILFDQPHVVAEADPLLSALGDEPLHHFGGDFFAVVPAGGDAYVLAQILHDWDDDRCRLSRTAGRGRSYPFPVRSGAAPTRVPASSSRNFAWGIRANLCQLFMANLRQKSLQTLNDPERSSCK